MLEFHYYFLLYDGIQKYSNLVTFYVYMDADTVTLVLPRYCNMIAEDSPLSITMHENQKGG